MVAMVEATAAAPQPGKPDRPDRKAVEAAAAAASAEIKGLQARIGEIKAQLDTSKSTRYGQSPELVEARNKLAVMKAAFGEEVEAKRQIKAELEAADKARDQARADARALWEKISHREKISHSVPKLDAIDGEIQRLEFRIQHTSLAINDEKSAVGQIKELKRSREVAVEYNQRMEQIGQGQAGRMELVERIREKDQLLTDLKMEINQQKKVIDGIRERDASKALDTSVLVAERNAAYDRINCLREEINAVWADFRERQEKFLAKRELAKERRAKSDEKQRAEWLERQKVRKRIAEENFVEVFTDEIILCDQLAAYLQRFAPVEVEVAEEKASAREVPSVEGFGMMLPSKKNRSEDDGWFAGKAKDGKGKKGNGAVPALSKERKEKLCLSLDALASFAKLGLVAPATVGETCGTIERLKTKKDDFVKLQAEAKAAREKGEEETKVAEVPVLEVPDEAAPQEETVAVAAA